MQLTGNITDIFIAFLSGLLVSFTPCVYPIIPITASVIGGINTNGSKLTGFFLSLLYVLGMALTYSVLGMSAALTGKIFGQIQNHPAIFFSVGAIFIVLALFMADWLPLPNLGVNLQHKIKPKNVWAVILLGAASGLVVGPCTAPVLGSLLVYVASKQNIWHGAALMFIFSYGVGASLILVGTFSGALSALPKSGGWLTKIKKFCAVLLLAIGIYYISRGLTAGSF